MQLQANLKSSMQLVDIGALSKISGVPPSTLRYYEELGLIQSVGRNGLRRQYSENTIVQLALIALGKAAGFSLENIHGMFDKDRNPELPRPTLLQRADALDRQAHRMKTLSNLLRHVAECPAPSHMACPKFRRLLQVASPTVPLAKVRPRGRATGDA